MDSSNQTTEEYSSYQMSTTSGSNERSENSETPAQIVKNNEDEDFKQDEGGGGGSSLSATAFNYINSIIGSGVIGMPYAMKEAGFGMGIILLILVAIITDYSLILLVKAGNISGAQSYQELMEKSFGTVGYCIISLMQFIFPFLAMVSYNVIFGDTITKVILNITHVDPNSILVSREFVIFMGTLLINFPLSLYRDIGKLAKMSFFSLIFITFIIISIFVRMDSFSDILESSDDAWVFVNPKGIPQAIGIMASAFMCHHNSFLLYCSIENATLKKWNKVTHASILVSLFTIVLFCVGGYLTFTGYVQGDLLNNYCWNDNLMTICRIFFSITILLTYPIECFVCREVITTIIEGKEIVENVSENMHKNRHIFITVFIVLLTFVISLLTDCLGFVLELNGILAAIPLAFILPALSYCKVTGDEPMKEKIPALLIGVFGITVTTVGIAVITINGDINDCYSENIMPYCFSNYTSGSSRHLIVN